MSMLRFVIFSSLFAVSTVFAGVNVSIVPQQTLPTDVVAGQSVVALYTVTNNTNLTLQNVLAKTLSQCNTNLPVSVSQSTDTNNTSYPYPLCSTTGTALAPGGQCTLKLLVNDTFQKGFALCFNNFPYQNNTASPLNVTQGAPNVHIDFTTNSGARAADNVITVPTDGTPVDITLYTSISSNSPANNVNIDLSAFGGAVSVVSRTGCDSFSASSSCTIAIAANQTFNANTAFIQGGNTNQLPITLQPPSVDSIQLSMFVGTGSILFTEPNQSGQKIMAFATDPATNGIEVDIATNELPSGVTSDSPSCVTQDIDGNNQVYHGVCYVTLTASEQAYGSSNVTISSSSSNVLPPSSPPTVAVEPSTLTINSGDSGNPIGLNPNQANQLIEIQNNGPFDWVNRTLNTADTNVATVNMDPQQTTCLSSNSIPVNGTCQVALTTPSTVTSDATTTLQAGGNIDPNPTTDSIYIKGPLIATLNPSPAVFTTPSSIITLHLENIDTVDITNLSVAFTNGSSTIHAVNISNPCTTITSENNCDVTLTASPSSWGSDSLTVSYTVNNVSKSLMTSDVSVDNTSLTLTGTGVSGSTIILQANQHTDQTFTITPAQFNWIAADLVFAPSQNSNFFSTTCNTDISTTSPCTVTFNTAGVSTLPSSTLTATHTALNNNNIDTTQWMVAMAPPPVWSPQQITGTSNYILSNASCVGGSVSPLCVVTADSTAFSFSARPYSYSSTQPTTDWSSALLISSLPADVNLIACLPDKSFCLSTVGNAQTYYVDNPAQGLNSWTQGSIISNTNPLEMSNTACTSTDSGIACAASGLVGITIELYLTTDPKNQSTNWQVQDINDGAQPGGVSCPDKQLCVATSNFNAYTINPSDNNPSWTATSIQTTGSAYTLPSLLSCNGTSPNYFCAVIILMGVDLPYLNNFYISNGSVSQWTLSSSNIDDSAIRGLSCPDTHLCVAVDVSGNVLTNSDPTTIGSQWVKNSVAPGLGGFVSVSCTGTSPDYLCVAVLPFTGEVYVSTNPTATNPNWVRSSEQRKRKDFLNDLLNLVTGRH